MFIYYYHDYILYHYSDEFSFQDKNNLQKAFFSFKQILLNKIQNHKTTNIKYNKNLYCYNDP